MTYIYIDVISLLRSKDFIHTTLSANLKEIISYIFINWMEHDHGYSMLSCVGLGMLTFNSARAIYHSNKDIGSISFVLISYLDILLLFWVLRLFEKEAPDSLNRERIKIAVWILCTILTVMFSWKVGAMMPFVLRFFVWLIASVSSLGGFYALFLHQRREY
jgi:Family of unknown function (DUF6490)